MRSRGATPAPRRDGFACRIIRERVSRRRPTGLGPRRLRRPSLHCARRCAPAGPRDPELRIMQLTRASSATVRSHALRALSVIDPHTSPSAMTSSSLRCPVVRSHPDGSHRRVLVRRDRAVASGAIIAEAAECVAFRVVCVHRGQQLVQERSECLLLSLGSRRPRGQPISARTDPTPIG